MAVLVVAVAACSSHTADAPPPTISPAQAADAPPVTTPPTGEVLPLSGPGLASTFDRATHTLVVLGSDAAGRSVVTMFAPSAPARTVPLPTAGTALAGDARGTAYVSTRGGYFRVEVSTGAVTRLDVDGARDVDFTAIARRDDGNVVLGSSDGAVYTLGSDKAVAARLQIFARVDALVAQDDTVVVLDRGQTSVTTVDASGTKAEHALRAGDGATTIAADSAGRVMVADTRGDELLVFGADPLLLRQRYPVPGAPYGLTGSAKLAWVSETAMNSVVGYDLATGIPVEKVRYRTVRQPNSLAFDDDAGTLYVVSGSGAGVQVIRGAAK
jgi:DNA-binding beta-propeller fold protein YncE